MAVLTRRGLKTPRLMLHASELNFIHPVSGEPVNARHAAPF
jgi:tRNA pseudouridine32 synthase/23S rRNA pseudouridine746 synthase